MNDHERLIRDFYAARASRDWQAVRNLLAEDVVWRESGSEDYSGHHHGRDDVVALLARLVDVTRDTFALEPKEVFCTAEHVAANVRWSAERDGTRVEGNDLAVFRIAGGAITEAWFFPDGYEADALSEVFSFATSE
jgi:uncharacterized protein